MGVEVKNDENERGVRDGRLKIESDAKFSSSCCFLISNGAYTQGYHASRPRCRYKV